MGSEAKPVTRCAVYTRKSSEEGLEQSFNSLDAQREACRAFIGSQKHEGWRTLKSPYDDGGYSGATMERPALKCLLEDVRAGKIDTVVVYKVDRLTRSLADFAKIIEIFDLHKVSFVSVTQQFNTTTSMGRLTLNVLLSFAQFEREVTGERIRDKIAASKRKGMWMGGNVPLGYDVKNRKLVANSSEAAAVREIFRQYLKRKCVSKLKTYLERSDIRSKQRISQSGRKTGGFAYSRGALYKVLQNRIYRGEIEHRGQVYPGEHEPIIPRQLWDRVQTQLRANNHAHQNGSRAATPSLLVGLIYDEHENRFTPAHAVKSGKRYRYYVSQAAIRNPGKPHNGPTRIPAGEVERIVCSELQSFLGSRNAVLDALATEKSSGAVIKSMLDTANGWSKKVSRGTDEESRLFVRQIISRIVIHAETLDLRLDRQALWNGLLRTQGSSPPTNKLKGSLSLKIKVRLKRCGRETRFVLPSQSASTGSYHPVPSLFKAIARARAWYDRVVRGELTSVRSIALATGLNERYVNRIFACAFLAPDIVQSILDGRQPSGMTLENLRSNLPSEWATQRQMLGFSVAVQKHLGPGLDGH